MSRIKRVEQLLNESFQLSSLSVHNFSHEHNVADGAESHLRVRIVSEAFEGLRSVKRHQMVYAALTSEMSNGLHALQIQALSPAEATSSDELTSPKCRGGEP